MSNKLPGKAKHNSEITDLVRRPDIHKALFGGLAGRSLRSVFQLQLLPRVFNLRADIRDIYRGEKSGVDVVVSQTASRMAVCP